MSSPDQNTPPLEQPPEDSILKPKQRKSPNLTPEQRAAAAERLRKINAERIAKSKSAQDQKLKEQKQAEKEAKKKELMEEVERLKQRALANAVPLAKIPKKKYVRKQKEEEYSDGEEYEELLRKVREIPIKEPEPEYEPEPEPVRRAPRTRSVKEPAPVAVAPPKIVCKFL
jgi:hypothetical protein